MPYLTIFIDLDVLPHGLEVMIALRTGISFSGLFGDPHS